MLADVEDELLEPVGPSPFLQFLVDELADTTSLHVRVDAQAGEFGGPALEGKPVGEEPLRNRVVGHHGDDRAVALADEELAVVLEIVSVDVRQIGFRDPFDEVTCIAHRPLVQRPHCRAVTGLESTDLDACHRLGFRALHT